MQTDVLADRQPDRNTARLTHKHTSKQTHSKRERHTHRVKVRGLHISQNHPILKTKTAPKNIHKSARSHRPRLTLEYVNTRYPEDQWTHAYTDSSVAEATGDEGGGMYIRYNDGKAHITIATGKYSINFKAEAEALNNNNNNNNNKNPATEIRDNLPQTKPNVVIFTDALSVLNKLQNPS